MECNMELEDRIKIHKVMPELVKKTDEEMFKIIFNTFLPFLSPRMASKIQDESNFENRKRKFYEMITKRGPQAYTLLVSALYSTGLNNILDSKSGSSISREVINNNITQEFQRYKNNSKPKGNVLVINNKNFIGVGERKGSENDVTQIVDTWEQFGYNVVVKEDLSKTEFREEVKNFAESVIHEEADSAWLFIMTHGSSDTSLINDSFSCPTYLFSSDHQRVEVNWIIRQFDNITAKALHKKPKVIVFQSCRGNIPSIGVASDASSRGNIEPKSRPSNIVPNTSDLLIVFSTLPGHTSTRCTEKGAIFIQELCRVAQRSEADNLHIVEIVNTVNRKMKIETKEVANYTSMGFDRNLYL